MEPTGALQVIVLLIHAAIRSMNNFAKMGYVMEVAVWGLI